MGMRFKRFISYYKPHLKVFLLVLAAGIVSSLISLVLPLGIRYLTDEVLTNELSDAGMIVTVLLFMLVLLFVQTVMAFLMDYHGHRIGAEMESTMREELFEQYQRLSFSFYNQEKTGQLMSRLSNDLLALAEFFHHAPEDLVVYLIKFVGAFIILGIINWRLTLIIILILPLMTVYTLYFNKRMGRAYRSSRKKIGDVNAQVEDSLAGIRIVKSYANEEIEIAKFSHENKLFLKSRKDIYFNEAVWSQGTMAFISLISIAVAGYGSYCIIQGALSIADLVVFLLYISYITDPIRRLSFIVKQYQEGFSGFERFMEILETVPDIKSSAEASLVQNVEGNLTFRNVSFCYNSKQGNVLQDINLEINPGEHIALVGYSGVGKSTLCALIPRFYDVTAGSICIDSIDVRDYQLRSLRKQIGIVQQEIYLFAGTILDNIIYGNPDASMEEVVEAAKKAHAHDFIMKLPDGYDTDIGQRGVRLSGGQKQRISIARLFLKNPAILIVDEATSSLDYESERVVLESLAELAAGRTMIVIAHRLSTIRKAKRIIVLSNEGLIEEGTHEELLNKKGHYYNLYQTQY